MKNIISLTVAFATYFAAPSQAATVIYRLYSDYLAQGPNTFKLTAQLWDGDAFGIAYYGIELVGNPAVPTGNILTVNHSTLRGFDIESTAGGDPGSAGFTLLRSADDNNPTGSNSVSILGVQDVTDPSAHLIRGFGTEASSAAEKGLVGFFPEGNPWGNAGFAGSGAPGEFEIARGTLAMFGFGNTAIDFAPNPTTLTVAGVFTSASGSAVAEAQVFRVNMNLVIPEPTTFAMSALGLVRLVSLRRRRMSQPRFLPAAERYQHKPANDCSFLLPPSSSAPFGPQDAGAPIATCWSFDERYADPQPDGPMNGFSAATAQLAIQKRR